MPEPVSPSYRSRVLKMSGACRSHRVKHVPDFHMNTESVVAVRVAVRPDVATLAASRKRSDQEKICALGGIRTPNLLIRSQMLYPLSYERWFMAADLRLLVTARPKNVSTALIHLITQHFGPTASTS